MTKRIISCVILLVSYFTSIAQVNFKLQADGRFVTEDGADYVVVPFEGKTAHELFVMLTSNITSIYRDASKVMNTVEDNVVKVRGFAENGTIFPFITMFRFSVEGYYQLEFKVRDGRIRVSAPYIENEAMYTGGPEGPIPVTYTGMIQKHLFDENGNVKKKRAKDVASIETFINSIINRILTESEVIEEEW